MYKSGSFTRASEILATSQPTISEQIKTLEKKLGCKLFDRLGRTIRPTSKAELLFPKALSVLEEINLLEEEMAMEDQCITGDLILGASTIPGAYILPRLATAFKEEHPEISFEIRIADSGEVIGSVLNHELLLGIVGSKTASPKLQFTPFLEDQLVLAAAVKRNVSSTVSMKKFLKLPFLLRENGSGTRRSMEELGAKTGFATDQLNTVAVLGSNAAIKEAIKVNLGVSILSRISIRDELENGRIKESKVKGVTMKRMLYAVTLKKRTLPVCYRVFLARLLDMKK